jgi:hypothetical protein
MVISMAECPTISMMIRGLTPSARSRLTQVWRRSCVRREALWFEWR